MTGREELSAKLSAAGFIAAEEEANLLLERARGNKGLLKRLVARRLTGEPLAWIVEKTTFCGRHIRIDPGVYVPRPQTEQLARRAVARLPENGVAVDVCTGSGAIAATLTAERPRSSVFATDIHPLSVRCAERNGVHVYQGDLFDPLPDWIKGRVDVVVAVVPYVPTVELGLLQRDTFRFETPLAYDGGPAGTVLLRRVLQESVRFLKPGGALLVELGGMQAELLRGDLSRLSYSETRLLLDEEGDLRGLEALLKLDRSAPTSKSYTDP
jgi:release factor glutamine methyltransferase